MFTFGGTQSVIRTIRDCSIGADHVRVVPTWDGAGRSHDPRLLLRAARTIVRCPRHVVVHFHITNGGAWLREGGLITLARVRGLRVVVTLHGYEFPTFAREHPRFVRFVLSGARHVICLSGASRDAVVQLVPNVPVTILANPVEIDCDAPPADRTPPVALFAGAVGLRKGVDVLVAAWRILIERGVPGECRIVGPPEDYLPPQLERLTVDGPVHPTEVAALIRGVRLVVLPSRAEGMPMILTESLAGARPFVATPVGGTRDITPVPEMIVPIGDANALADAMARYLTDPVLATEAGKRGQQHIIETRSPLVIDEKLRAIYRDV